MAEALRYLDQEGSQSPAPWGGTEIDRECFIWKNAQKCTLSKERVQINLPLPPAYAYVRTWLDSKP